MPTHTHTNTHDIITSHLLDFGANDLKLQDDVAPHTQHCTSPQMMGHWERSHNRAAVALQQVLIGKKMASVDNQDSHIFGNNTIAEPCLLALKIETTQGGKLNLNIS